MEKTLLSLTSFKKRKVLVLLLFSYFLSNIYGDGTVYAQSNIAIPVLDSLPQDSLRKVNYIIWKPINKDVYTTPSSFLIKKEWIRQSIAPAFLLTSSFLVWGDRDKIRKARNRYVPNFSNHMDNYLQYAPGAGVFALKLAGQKGRNSLKRTTLNWVVSMAIMGTFVNSIKYSAKVMRPDGTSRNSFPSGHTATAFMNATFLHKEYGAVNPAYSIAGYTIGSYVGTSRSLNNRHWISDILAGAAIGIVSTELAYAIVDHFYHNKGDYFSDFDIRTEIEKPSYFSARMGYSFDIGDGQFTPLGIESTIEGAYYFSRHWGIMGEVTFANYPMKAEKWTGGDLKFENLTLENPESQYQSMGMFYFMVGPQYSKMIASKFMLQMKLTAGAALGANGKMSLVGDAKMENGLVISDFSIPLVDYKPQISFVAGTGINLTAMMTPRIGLSWFMDYKYTRSPFSIKPAKDVLGDQLNDLNTVEKVSINNLSSGLRFTAFFD